MLYAYTGRPGRSDAEHLGSCRAARARGAKVCACSGRGRYGYTAAVPHTYTHTHIHTVHCEAETCCNELPPVFVLFRSCTYAQGPSASPLQLYPQRTSVPSRTLRTRSWRRCHQAWAIFWRMSRQSQLSLRLSNLAVTLLQSSGRAMRLKLP